MRATTKTAAVRKQEGEQEGDTGPPFRNRVETGRSLSPPRPPTSPRQGVHGAGERRRARGPYRSSVDGGEDRWIGFAGSPRGERPTQGGGRQSDHGDSSVGEELVRNGVEYYAAGGSPENRRQDNGREATEEFVAAPQGEAWAAEESEAFLEEGLEEMLSGTSR